MMRQTEEALRLEAKENKTKKMENGDSADEGMQQLFAGTL